MKYCPNCGRAAQDEDIFCNGCGTMLSQGTQAESGQASEPEAGMAAETSDESAATEQTNAPEDFTGESAADTGAKNTESVTEDAPEGAESAEAPKAEGAPTADTAPALTEAAHAETASAEAAPAGTAAPAGGEKKGLGKKMIAGFCAAAAAIVLVLAIVVTAASGAFMSGASKFKKLIYTSVVDTVTNAVSTSSKSDVDKVSTDMTITASVDNKIINKWLEDSSLILKLDAKEDSCLMNAELNVMGSTILTGFFTYDDGEMGFYLPEADSTYYVMDLEEMLDKADIDNSVLRGMDYPYISGKDAAKLFRNYADVILSVINKNNVTVEKNKTVYYSCLSGRFNGTVYTFTPGAKDVENMLLKLADNLEKDKTLRKQLKELIESEYFAEMLREQGIRGIGMDDVEDFLDELVEEIRLSAEDMGEDLEDSGFFVMTAFEGKTLRTVRIGVNGGSDSETAIAYECKGDEKSGKKQALVYEDKYYERSQAIFENSYTKKGKTYKGELSIAGNGLVIEYNFQTDKRSELGMYYGSFEVSSPEVDGMTITLDVKKGEKGGTDHILGLTVDRWYSRYYLDSAFTRAEMCINTSGKGTAKKPDAKHKKDISDYSERELEELFEDLLGSMANAVADIMYDSRL